MLLDHLNKRWSWEESVSPQSDGGCLLCARHCMGYRGYMKIVRDKVHKLIGTWPDKYGPSVRYKTLGEQREMALGMSQSLQEGLPWKKQLESWVLKCGWGIVTWWTLGPGGEKGGYSRQNKQQEQWLIHCDWGMKAKDLLWLPFSNLSWTINKDGCCLSLCLCLSYVSSSLPLELWRALYLVSRCSSLGWPNREEPCLLVLSSAASMSLSLQPLGLLRQMWLLPLLESPPTLSLLLSWPFSQQLCVLGFCFLH